MVLWVFLGFAVIAAAWFYFSEKAVRQLRWSDKLGYYGFRRNITRFLRRDGWNVHPGDRFIDFHAVKGKFMHAVVLLPSGKDATEMAIRDIYNIRTDSTLGRPVTCIASRQPHPYFRDYAERHQIRLLWYKELEKF